MPVERFTEVLEDLRAKILDGTYPVGEPLPHTERLKETYGVSAATITRATKSLKDEGLIWRVANRGMIVQGPPVVIDIPLAITRMDEVREWVLACRRAGTTGHLTPVSSGFRHDTATPDVAQALDLDEGTPVATWESHGTIAQQVVCIDHTYVSRERHDAGPDAFDVPRHAALVDLRTSVRTATADEARTMKISRGSPVLDVIRITRDDTGPVQMLHRTLNPQRVRLVERGLTL
ncbi:GntR family transcriptional regulator [Microtetraspora malaysiensis]|uniref:GntR family transcriptional regulator n=1 Tax=Microtetraspora malaysiensis TaxID=161358 RepID=UPI003D8F82EF